MKPKYKKPSISNTRFLGHFNGYDAYYYKAIGGDAIYLKELYDEHRRVISEWVRGRVWVARHHLAFEAAIKKFEIGEDPSISPNAT